MPPSTTFVVHGGLFDGARFSLYQPFDMPKLVHLSLHGPVGDDMAATAAEIAQNGDEPPFPIRYAVGGSAPDGATVLTPA